MASRILAVEDEARIRRFLSRFLERAGHEVVCAADGDEALRLVDTDDFDLALVDYNIPGPNGLEVLRHLRERQPDCVRILSSGSLDLPVTVDAVNQGEVARVLEKPYEWQQLVALVDDALVSRRRSEERHRRGVRSDAVERKMLRECLAGETIQLALQPIVNGVTTEVVAFEALLRSTHPVLNGPLPVLRAAEQCDMLDELGAVVAERASRWIRVLPRYIQLFVNLHPNELANPERVRERLAPLQPWANRIVLEITERSRITDVEAWQQSIGLITGDGFSIALDDLGSGYSSLSMLAELQPQYIKLDMSIIRGVDADPRKQRLVDLLARFAEATDARLVAEGVETEGEARAVRLSGAHLIQGYLYGRPSLEMPDMAVQRAIA